jgi:hypothetical protein
MPSGDKTRIKSVQVTGRSLQRLTATEIIGGVTCRITLEQDHAGRYQEISCTPLSKSPGRMPTAD